MANVTEQHGHLDFLKTAQIQNAIMQTLTSAPGTPNEAQMYYDQTIDKFRIYDLSNTAWVSMLKDGSYTDIDISVNETVLTINAGAVTLAKMANIATDSFLGRITAATGVVEVLTTAQATSMLDLFSTATAAQGLVPGSSGATTTFLRADGTWASPAGGFADFDAGGDTGANVTVADGDLYDVTGNTGLNTTISKAATTVTLDIELDLDNLAEKTGDLVGTDRLTGVSGTTHFSETISAIPLSIFSNDSVWTSNVGTVTSVSAGNGMTFTTITGSGPVTMGTPTGLTSATTNSVAVGTHEHSLDISGFASTVLSDTANIVYTNAARSISVTHTINTGSTLTLTDAPSTGTDAANKAYVDSVAQGLDVKDSVKVMSDSNLDLTGEETIDGVLTSTNRVLVTGQTATEDNGIYVSAAGAWARASDMDTWDEHISAFVFVEQGTTYADTGWVCTVDSGGTLDITSITWVQFSGAGSYSTGNGLTGTTVFTLGTPSTLTGSTTNDVTASSHTHDITTGIADNDIVEIDSASVATGEYAKFTANGLESKTVAEMVTELSIPQKFTQLIGDTTTTAFTITHNLGTRDVIVRVREEATPYTFIDVPIESDTTNAVGIDFLIAPGTDEYRVIVIG